MAPTTYLYMRVSTVEQADNGNSLATQRERLHGYATSLGMPNIVFVTDGGVSGSVPLSKRPEGGKMLAKARAGDAIVAVKLDRAFRSARDALDVLENLKKRKVALHCLDLGGDCTTNGIGGLLFTIMAAVASFERERIGERIREAKAHLAAKGVYGGGMRPFGFDVVDGKLVPNKAEQEKLATMRTLRRDGKSYRQIAAVVGIGAMSVKRILDRGA